MGITLHLLGSITLLVGFFSLSYSVWVYNSALQPGYSPWCTPSDPLETPSTVKEIQSIIRRARLSGKKLKAFGARHSTPDIICTDGIPISMENFQKMTLNMDSTVTFGTGVHLGDAMTFLKSKGRTLIHIPGFLGITIGGAIGTGAHGSSAIHPTSISQLITKLTIVDGLGFIHDIHNGPELNTFRIHLGLLGVITSVTLSTVPIFKLYAERFLVLDSYLTDGTMLSWAETYDFLQISWYPDQQNVVVARGKIVNASTTGNAILSLSLCANSTAASASQAMEFFDALQVTRNVHAFSAIEENTILSSVKEVVGRPPIYSEDLHIMVNPAVGYHYELIAGDCTACLWNFGNYSFQGEETEIAVDLSELPKIVPTIKGILAQIPTAWPLARITLRFHSQSNAVLSFAHRKRSVIIDLIYPTRIDPNQPKTSCAAFQAIAQAMIEKHAGRPHWGKGGLYYHSRDVMSKAIPFKDWLRFKLAMSKYDPNGMFHNKFARRFLGTGTAQDARPDVTRCALRDYCRCSKDGDCGDNQSCTNLPDVDGETFYKVCKDLLRYSNKPVGTFDPLDMNSIIHAILYG